MTQALNAECVLTEQQMFDAKERAKKVVRKLQKDKEARPYTEGIVTPFWDILIGNPTSYRIDGYCELNFSFDWRRAKIEVNIFLRLDEDGAYHIEDKSMAIVSVPKKEPIVRDYSGL